MPTIRPRWPTGTLLTALVVLAGVPCDASSSRPATPDSDSVALDYAFRFASAIHTDAKDQSLAQEGVVLEYANLGLMDEAVRRSDLVAGWRRGTSYADLAQMLASRGRKEEARTLLRKAQEYVATVDGWQQKRIEAHLAQALAALGEVDQASAIATGLAENDPRQYAGRSLATMAASHAVGGNFEEAMIRLRSIDVASDFDVTWWRTVGYLSLAKERALSTEQRLEALAAARESAAGIDGWKRVEALQGIAEQYGIMGQSKKMREALEAAEGQVLALPESMPMKCLLLSLVAGGWGEAGDEERAAGLLKLAETGTPRTLVIDQPGIYATVAFTYGSMGAEKEAARLYDIALQSAEGLVNARPRALAVVDIARSMARAGFDLDEMARGRFDRLFSGLKDPW